MRKGKSQKVENRELDIQDYPSGIKSEETRFWIISSFLLFWITHVFSPLFCECPTGIKSEDRHGNWNTL